MLIENTKEGEKRGMEKNYYYKILGVTPEASMAEIDQAFRRVIKIYHPDSGATNDEMVKDILRAYNVLSDEERRRKYDAGEDNGHKEEGASSVVKQEHTEKAEFVQRDYDTRSRRETIQRLQEGEDILGEVSKLLRTADSMQAELRPMKGWFRLLPLSALLWIVSFYILFVFLHETGNEIWIVIEAFVYIIVWPIVTIGWMIARAVGNQKNKKYNKKETMRIKLEKEKLVAQANNLLEMEEEKLMVLPRRFQYCEAFKGIHELIEDGRADNMKEAINLYEQTRYQNDMRDGIKTIAEELRGVKEAVQSIKVDVTVW